MATTLNDNIYVSGQKHVDGKRLRLNDTPWTSAEEVILSIEVGDRAESQEFYIVDKLWWFKGGVEDENLVEKLEGGSIELVTKFTSTVIPTVDDSTIIIPANNTWLFDSVPYTNTVTNVLPFDYAAEGFSYFLTIVATKFNTFVAKVGSQSISNPDEPIINEENELFLTTYLIYDNYIDVVVPPVSPNIYVEKESFAPLNLISSGHVASIEIDKRNNLIFSGNITKTGNVIKNNSNHFVVGLPFTTTNKTANPIEIQHLNTSGGSGSVAYFNPEELSYFLQPNEVAIWICEILAGQKIHRRISSYINRDNVIFRSGTEVGKPVTGDVEIGDGTSLATEEVDGIKSLLKSKNGKWIIEITDGIDNPSIYFDPDKGIFSNKLFYLDNDENAYIQKGHIVQLEEDVFNLQIANTGDETTASIQTKRPLKTVNGNSLEGSGNIVIGGGGGGAVDSVNGQTGVVVLDADDIDETATRVYVTPSEKTAITHSNRSILDNITEAFTTGLKTSYDSAVTWISTNGTNLLNHLLITDNPHSVTKTQVGLGNVDNTSDVDKPISNATQTALNNKQATLTDTNFGTFTTSVADKNTQADNDVLAYVDVTTGKWVKQTFSKLVDYLKGFFQTSRIIVTSDITAVNGSVYHNNGNNTFTDPTPENNRGYYVLNVSGSSTIGGNTYSAETYLFRYYNGTTWITNVIKNGTTQKDVVASRDYLPSDHNCLLKIKANVTLTIPASGLPDNFTLVARTFSGATLTNAKAVGVTTDATTGLVLPPFKMQTLFKDASTNTYIISGELTT